MYLNKSTAITMLFFSDGEKWNDDEYLMGPNLASSFVKFNICP